MFAYFGQRPLEVKPHFLDGNNSLLRQAVRHPDGWGIIYADNDGNYTYEKENLPASKSPRFRELGKELSSRLILGHMRQATYGLVVPENLHPFSCGKWMFAHNGSIFKFSLIKSQITNELPEHLLHCVKGTTDSEHLFAVILSEIEKLDAETGQNIANAIRNGITRINDYALAAGAHGDSFMNILLTNGKSIWGARFGKPLKYFIDPENLGVTIASERTDTRKSWKTIPQNTVFSLSPDGQNLCFYPLLMRAPQFGFIAKSKIAFCM